MVGQTPYIGKTFTKNRYRLCQQWISPLTLQQLFTRINHLINLMLTQSYFELSLHEINSDLYLKGCHISLLDYQRTVAVLPLTRNIRNKSESVKSLSLILPFGASA